MIEALELAFKAIDTESQHPLVVEQSINIQKNKLNDPIYENVEEINELYEEIENDEKQLASKLENRTNEPDEPYYQVPKSSPPEPYYQVPNPKPVPLYENIEIMYTSSNMKYPAQVTQPIPIALKTMMEPPKEKPPPPPADASTDDEVAANDTDDDDRMLLKPQEAMKRMNSTKRIKKEIRNKRTSFLGIEGVNLDDDNFLELSVAPPPDMSAFIQEERRLEKQMYIKAGLYDSSDTTDSRDSGVSENHSRQSSEPLTTSSEEQDDYIAKQEQEIINVLEKEEQRRRSTVEDGQEQLSQKWDFNDNFRNENELISNRLNEEARMRCLEDQIREQEEVLRVERELLQLEQEELKRQRENLLIRENMARRELDHGAKMLMSANRHSLQDINATINHYANVPTAPPITPQRQPIYQQVQTEYRQSMPNLLQDMSLHEFNGEKSRVPPIPPAKPMRSHLSQEVLTARDSTVRHSRMANGDGGLEIIHSRNHSAPIKQSQSIDDFVQLRNPTLPPHHIQPNTNGTTAYGNMTKHTLHALSAVPKPKFQDGWVQKAADKQEILAARRRKSDYVNTDNYLRMSSNNKEQRVSDTWLAMQQHQQQKRKSDPLNFNYNKHWLIQEAEQRRLEQQRGLRQNNNWNSGSTVIQRNGFNDNKPLPDAVIQTLTQRVQSRGLGERKK